MAGGGGMVRDCSPVQYQQLPDILQLRRESMTLHSPMCPKLFGHIGKTSIRPSGSQSSKMFWFSLVRPVGRMGRNFRWEEFHTFEADEEACCFWVQRKSRYKSNPVWHVRCLYHSDPSYVLAYTIVYYNRPAMVVVAKKCTYIYIYIHIIYTCMFLYVQKYFSWVDNPCLKNLRTAALETVANSMVLLLILLDRKINWPVRQVPYIKA